MIIYGAGNGGVAALHEIRSNPVIGMRAVGFFDDDQASEAGCCKACQYTDLRNCQH